MDTGNHWKDNGEDFFLPVKVVSRLFRGKYLAELKQLWEEEKLEFYGTAGPYKNHYAFKELLDSCYRKEWTLYCKKPFHGAESVIQYLGKYTHRIAISNYRIKNMTKDMVTFTAKDYKNQGKWKEVTISGEPLSQLQSIHSFCSSYASLNCSVLLHTAILKQISITAMLIHTNIFFIDAHLSCFCVFFRSTRLPASFSLCLFRHSFCFCIRKFF